MVCNLSKLLTGYTKAWIRKDFVHLDVIEPAAANHDAQFLR